MRSPEAGSARAAQPSSGSPEVRAPELSILHALAWLAAGSLVGLWMATLLIWPRLGALLGPLTYGRWATLHLDLLLYGWCSLPVVGLLLRGFGASVAMPRLAASAVHAWSGSLLFAALWWLAGHSSGRLFVEWSGPSRAVFVGSLAWLWGVLAMAHWKGLRDAEAAGRGSVAGRTLLLLALGLVPWTFWAGTRPSYHPPINPASGGPTGAGLLASSLGLVALLIVAPPLLGLAARGSRRLVRLCWLALALHFLFFGLVRGEHTHREPLQVVALASITLWFPLLVRVWGSYSWPAGIARWGSALVAWGGLLVATAVVPYLVPGILDAWKFTSALVAHAHLAMAGMLTSFVAVLIGVLAEGTRLQGVLARRGPFWLWHAGCAAFVVSMTALGVLEGGHPGLVFEPGARVFVLYGARWVAGAAMAGATIGWLAAGHLAWPAPRPAALDSAIPRALREAS